MPSRVFEVRASIPVHPRGPNPRAVRAPRTAHAAASCAAQVFPRGAAYALKGLGEDGFDVLTLDGTAQWDTVRDELPPVCLQGAFDPKILIDGTVEEVRRAGAAHTHTHTSCGGATRAR